MPASRQPSAAPARLPSDPRFWRSPVRGVRFTSVLGLVLLGGITVLFVTGLLSYAAYNPDLAAVNDKTPEKGLLGFYLFAWPTGPHWLYRVTQGVHVTLGVVLVPVLLAKLWSVIPRLFALPPARSVGIVAAGTGERWRLTLTGPAGELRLSRAQLLALEQHTAALPIACVEGWSTATSSGAGYGCATWPRSPGTPGCGCWRAVRRGWSWCGSRGRRSRTTWCWCRCTRWRTGP